MSMDIGTPQVPNELIRAGYVKRGEAPSYRTIYNAILDGRIDAYQVNGRYRVPRSQLPKIAALFGLSGQSSSEAA